MKFSDITGPYQGTATHPYLATIIMDPVRWDQFRNTFEDQPEVNILGTDRSRPDEWTIYVACASRACKDLLESNW